MYSMSYANITSLFILATFAISLITGATTSLQLLMVCLELLCPGLIHESLNLTGALLAMLATLLFFCIGSIAGIAVWLLIAKHFVEYDVLKVALSKSKCLTWIASCILD